MKLERVVGFLKSLPVHSESTDRTQIYVRCPFCGDSRKDSHSTHFSIRVDVREGEPLLYRCFQPDYKCGAKGILKTDTLQKLGCTDMETILELSKYNNSISKHLDANYVSKKAKNYQMVNLDTKFNRWKLQYINHRLGTDLTTSDLRELKIQLGLADFVRLNNIKRLAFKPKMCEILDQWCIGFMSMYSDYIIFRDFSDDRQIGEYNKPITGRRYTMYRTSGTPNPEDMKLYSIPTDIDLLDPEPANINIAEGTFTILGAYLNTNIGKDQRNSIFLANCGTGYKQTIDHVCHQYGLLKININIFSDSEVPLSMYTKLYNTIKDRYDICSFKVYYNEKAEDFGHAKKDIKPTMLTIV